MKRLQNNLRRPVTDSSSSYVSILNGDDGVFYVFSLQVMYNNFTVRAELYSQTMSKSCVEFNKRFFIINKTFLNGIFYNYLSLLS